MVKQKIEENVTIKQANIQEASFDLTGTAPLVIHRMSMKYQRELEQKMANGGKGARKPEREPVVLEDIFNAARYTSAEGWDGIHAGAFRAAMVSACRLANFKMTIAKLSIFIIADGWDETEPQIPLVRIYGKPVLQKDMARTSTGDPVLSVRPAYHNWQIKLRIRYDADQFKMVDIANLLQRVGLQVGIGEGRPDSKKSCGMGWGTFSILKQV